MLQTSKLLALSLNLIRIENERVLEQHSSGVLNLYIHEHILQIIEQSRVLDQHRLGVHALHIFRSDADTNTFYQFLKGQAIWMPVIACVLYALVGGGWHRSWGRSPVWSCSKQITVVGWPSQMSILQIIFYWNQVVKSTGLVPCQQFANSPP